MANGKQANKQKWTHGLWWSISSQIISFEIILQIYCSTQNYSYHIKTSELWERMLKNISYLLSQFRLKYIKCSCIFSEQTKNGDVLFLQTISMESGVSGNLVCSVSMFETDHFTWIHSLWDFWLDMLFCTTPLPCLLLLMGHPQAFAIKSEPCPPHGLSYIVIIFNIKVINQHHKHVKKNYNILKVLTVFCSKILCIFILCHLFND